ncbi:hypothetical protein HKD37_20G055522 [Glycine soja]
MKGKIQQLRRDAWQWRRNPLKRFHGSGSNNKIDPYFVRRWAPKKTDVNVCYVNIILLTSAFALSSSSNLRLAKPSLCASEHRVRRTRASSQVSASSPSPPYLGRASCSSHSSIVRSLCFFSFATSRRYVWSNPV